MMNLQEYIGSIKNLKLLQDEGTFQHATSLGLSAKEFSLIKERISRTPTFTEVCMFSGMWSEHCSYKHSILLLKKLYSDSERSLSNLGEENAGVLKIDDKKAVVFKMESHNHPSAIEPYQGAATGVGGIMRDIFTMGARPLVTLNLLRIGPLYLSKNRYYLKEIVKGIGDYANSLGVACAGGETFFDSSYNNNPLVNAMTIGIVNIDDLASSSNSSEGCLLVYAGAKTGRDGVHGASFSSRELSKESEEERSSVQVGDPFIEKLVLEATLECIQKKLVVSIQDMGAAGLLSSSSEMSSSANIGMDLFLDFVPTREEDMQPFEFLLSESQERMLMVVQKENIQKVESIFLRYHLESAIIGITTSHQRLRIFFEHQLFADLPVNSLCVHENGAPRYQPKSSRPNIYLNTSDNSLSKFQDIKIISKLFNEKNVSKIQDILLSFLSDFNICSKSPLYEQYDTDIGIQRVQGPGQNCGIYRVPDSDVSLTAVVDANSYYVYNDPYLGTQHSVAESYRNLVSVGSTPIGITNCLNFASPEVPEKFYFLEQSIYGLSDAAETLKIPVTGGNVSLYNETKDGSVLPTPAIGMVGILDNIKQPVSNFFYEESIILLIGFFQPSLNSSYYSVWNNPEKEPSGILPELDLKNEQKVASAIFEMCPYLSSCIDLSIGGIWLALVKKLLSVENNVQRSLLLDLSSLETTFQKDFDKILMGETSASYLISIQNETSKNSSSQKIYEILEKHNIPFSKIGVYTKTEKPILKLTTSTLTFDIDISLVNDAWKNPLREIL